MNITATVAMPLYNMGKIAELALEGLCNQVTDYKWELIVCEEQTENKLGLGKLEDYRLRLEQAGCVNFIYIPLQEWIPLGQKWKIMADLASDTECFILQAGDDMPHPKRISETINAFIFSKCNYYDEQQGLFYSFKNKKTILFNPQNNFHHPCRLNMAYSTKLMKRISPNTTKRGVDKFIKSTINKIEPIRNFRNQTLFMNGVFTDGYNLISKRNNLYHNSNKMFVKIELDALTLMPVLNKFNT